VQRWKLETTMKKIERLILLAGAVTVFAATSHSRAAQFEHPDLKSGKKVVHSVLILPPQAKVVKSGMKGSESLVEESHQVEARLPAIVGQALAEKGCSLVPDPFTAAALDKDSDMKYALTDLQAKFDKLRGQLDRKPKDVRTGRFTMGDEVANFSPGASADALVFVRAEGYLSTGGKKAFTALVGSGYATDSIFVSIAVVDAQSGAVLYYARSLATGNFLEKPEHMDKPVKKSFKNFVGPAAGGKKS
jgi:hypothetical protein